MNAKAATAILLLAVFAFSIMAVVQIEPVKADVTVATLSDAEMMLSEFVLKQWGGTPSMTKTDVAGTGVQFDLTGLGKAGIVDDFPLNQLAGGAWDGAHYSDFTGYDYYSMRFDNLGTASFNVAIIMNTGYSSTYGWRDTFWQSNWATVPAGEGKVLTLNFSSVYEAYHIDDDLDFPGYSNGVQPPGTAMFRLDEVTSIGFQIEGSGAASVLVSGTPTLLYVDPPTVNKGPGHVDSFFDVYVKLENFANFAGFDIKLTWDSNLLTQIAVDYTTALDALWGAETYTIFDEESGAGYYNLIACDFPVVGASNTGSSDLFKLTFRVEEGCNFPLSALIHFEVAKLTDNSVPVALPIIAAVTDGTYSISGETPGLTLALVEPDTHPWEASKYFQVEVEVADIHDCSPLYGYDLTLLYDDEFAAFFEVADWGILGDTSDQAQVDTSISGKIRIWDTGGLSSSVDGLLFRVTLLVQYDDRPEHIWKYNVYESDTFGISIQTTPTPTLDFGSLGTLNPTVPSSISQRIYFIRGDVNSDGKVWIDDLNAVGVSYGLKGTSIYDLTGDLIVDIYDVVTLATNYDYGNT